MEGTGEICIGVDVGGTFTDCVLWADGRSARAKALTSPQDLTFGVLSACEKAAARHGSSLAEVLPRVRRFGLGTTAVTNLLTSGTGRRVGLLTTSGFEDLIPLARGHWDSEDGWLVRPRQIIDRRRIVGVDERVDRDGQVVRALDVDQVIEAGRYLIETQGVEAIAVSYLWSFRNPVHEEESLAALRKAFEAVPVTGGADQLPVMREYERTMFALLNAYSGAGLGGIDRLVGALAERGLRVPVLLVHSGGGSISVPEARQTPVSLAESGPAAGVAAALAVALSAGVDDAVTCDMGGTTFDVSVIRGGEPLRRVRGHLMGVWTALSSVDIQSVGAGGGLTAWVDALGMLRVGPASAGSDPGPACYGRGGTEATVTDAMLVLGYLAEDRFLGGDMALDRAAALAACHRLGARAGIGAVEAAWGVREVALAGMVSAVRGRLAEFGLEGSAHSIISYGGSSGLFTGTIAAQIGSPLVVVPEAASVLSAWGAATTDLRRERSRSVALPLPADPQVLTSIADNLRELVESDLDRDGVGPEGRRVTFEADMRFGRQKRELIVAFSDVDELVAGDGVVDAFRREYTERYSAGALMAGASIELAVLRAVGIGSAPHAGFGPAAVNEPPSAPAGIPDRTRSVSLERTGSPTDVPVLAWSELSSDRAVDGPALVDALDTTIWVPPGASAKLEPEGTLLMRFAS